MYCISQDISRTEAVPAPALWLILRQFLLLFTLIQAPLFERESVLGSDYMSTYRAAYTMGNTAWYLVIICP